MPMRYALPMLLCIAAISLTVRSLDADEQSDAPCERTLSLSGADWRICSDPDQTGADRRLFDADASNWTPATVPGNIQADLEAAHSLSPLWYGDGDPRLYDVPKSDWWYRKDFVVPPTLAGKRVALVFDGVDYQCEVWLNGKRLGANAGMFRQFSFDVADALLPGQTNRLAVRVARMPPEVSRFYEKSTEIGLIPGLLFEGINQMFQQLKDLKSPTNMGWDWGFNIWTLGIWKDVRLVATGPARIDNTHVQCALNDSYGKATITATLDADSLDPRPVQVNYRVFGNGQEVTSTSNVLLAQGRNTIKAEISLDKPALWWPNGQGDQPLYTLTAELVSADGGISLDACSTRFGIREVRWIHTDNAPADFVSRYQLVINGRPVRTMGSNLIPPDLLFGRATPKALQLLRRAKAAGMNTIRQWGGGVPLSDELYDLADELGIMISFEFALANVLPPTDEVFLGNFETTIRNIVRQVRNHPSIIEYSGGNEMPWNSLDQHPALLLMRRIVAEEDGRLLRATCPDLGAKHGPWVFFVPESTTEYNAIQYNNAEAMRAGEFGTISPANLEVWYRDIPPKSQAAADRTDDSVLVHKNAVQGAGRPQDWLAKPYIDDLFGPIDNIPDLVKAGQFLGADTLRYAVDAWRRKGRKLGGLTTWDFNEPWTNAAGSYQVDYDGRPLMNYDFVKQAIAPISLSLCYNSILYHLENGIQAELFITSDAPQPAAALRWKWLARDRRGSIFDHGEGEVSIEPIATKSLAKLDLKPPKATAFGPVFVELQLADSNGTKLAERICVFGLADVKLPLAGLLHNTESDHDDDVVGMKSGTDIPDTPANLAYVGNGAKPATASSARAEPCHQPAGLNDGEYGDDHGWIADAPRSWFQIDLGKPAMVDHFKLARDHTGKHSDRAADYLKIETSLDGTNWQTVFEKGGLAAIASVGLTRTTEIRIAPVETQFLKVTVDPEPATPGTFPCIDEFEVYASGQEPPRDLPRVEFTDTRPEIRCPVRRTSLTVSAGEPRLEAGNEIIDLVVKNNGTMTALFCEPHPLIEYRTDLFIDNNHCFIPPGESRTITVRAARSPNGGLTLSQTGWRISCWNADDVLIEPPADVLLAVGRKDAMCREFLGYANPTSVSNNTETTLTGTRPDPSVLPFILTDKSVARFTFNVDAAHATTKARLRLHTADQAADQPTLVQIFVGGRKFEATLPKGLGIQSTDPAHLAFPSTIEISMPPGTITTGENTIEFHVAGPGWFTWDALDLCTNNQLP